MNKTEGFDAKKPQTKTLSTFSIRRAPIDPAPPERPSSQFQGYKNPSNPNLPRTQELGVSRGIFQTRRDNMRDDNLSYSARQTSEGDRERTLSYYHRQVFQEFVNNDLKAQIEQFRSEMVQAMEITVKDFCEKSNRNQEVLSTIRESVGQQSYQIEKLYEKIEEHHINLDMINSMVQTEIGSIKQTIPSYRSLNLNDSRRLDENSRIYSLQKLQRIESQQQEILRDFERLKEEITESLQLTLEEYSQGSEQEDNDKINKILYNIKSNMEQKIEKVLEHLNGKVAVLEKQIQNYSRADDPVIDKIKFEIEDKINEQTQNLQEKIHNISRLAETKVDEEALRQIVNGSRSYEVMVQLNLSLDSGIDQKVDSAKNELESIKADLAFVLEKVKMETENLTTKIDDSGLRFNMECQQFKNSIPVGETYESYISKSPNKKSREEYEKKIDEIEKKFEEINQEQKGLEDSLNMQKSQLQGSKFVSAGSLNEYKAGPSQIEEIRLRKLEEIIDQLSENVGMLKTSLPNDIPGPGPARLSENRVIRQDEPSYKEPVVNLNIRQDNRSPNVNKKIDADNQLVQLIEKNQTPPEDINKDIRGSNEKQKPRPNQTQETLPQNQAVDVRQEPAQANSQEAEEDEDEVEVILEIDDEGYLMDEHGNFYYDNKGERIRLGEEQLARLKANNLIEEGN